MNQQEPTHCVLELSDAKVVGDLFAMAGREILYRLVQVSRRVMTAEKARDMDDALARHLARALMGENPEFKSCPGWSGMPCAKSLAGVDHELYDRIKGGESQADTSNPRVVMVLAATAFYHAVYDAIAQEMRREGVTQESVEAAVDRVVQKYALAAMAPQEKLQ